MADVSVGGEVTNLPLATLDLDPLNPRLPASLRDAKASQDDLALFIDKNHDALRVARSIDQHGFFVSEPLIAIPTSARRFTVVEGNRRLVALKGLSEPELRNSLERQTKGWASLGSIPRDSQIPVVVVTDRSQVDALLGFRHISGIEPWDPFAQARFIAELVERSQTFAEVAQIVGRTETEVRSMYRDHDIVEQAKTQFGLDTSRVEKSFGVFNQAMGLVKLRAYIDAPAPRQVDPDYFPLPEDSGRRVARLFEYMFGDERGRGRVITDSRQLRTLARILADERGSAEQTLRQTRDLQAALDATVSHETGARTQLQKSITALNQARQHIVSNGFAAGELGPLLDECRAALDQVAAVIERSEA